MSTLENVVADAVLILSTDIGHIVPHGVDIVEKIVTVITFVFLTTQFTHARYFEEGYHVYPRLQNNLPKQRVSSNHSLLHD